jgi:hypothetical protein
MSKLIKATKILFLVALVSTVVVACGPPETITVTATEAEFNEEGFGYLGETFEADFQPGKIVLTGEVEGEEAVIEMTIEIVDGEAVFDLLSATVGGQEIPQELFDAVDADLSVVAHTPDEGYAVTDVAITDDELTVTATLQQ